jgi:cytochrome c oxidase assembly protein subunit 11
MGTSPHVTTEASRHARVALMCAAIVVGMGGLAWASVPLYRLFCQVTGFGGTTMKAAKPSDRVLDRTITVRFDRNIGPGLAWTVEPLVNTMDVRIGETALAFYRATNISDRPVVGTSSFNVTPEQAGGFFNKLECFCFTEQTLAPGESIDMPVSFFVDPAIVDDRDGRSIAQITLSYTFYQVTKPAQGVADSPAAGTGGKGRQGS